MFLAVKAEVNEAIAAVASATTAAASIAQSEIQEALEAVMLLDDALSFFGLVGSPMDALCGQFAQQLTQLAFALDNRGYYAIYRKTFGAQAQFVAAKSSYDGFTGGMGGKSAGAGAQGTWGEAEPLKPFPWFGCHNRNGAQVRALGSSTPPPAEAIDMSVLLGPCSDVFVYTEDNPNGYWQAGIYQYARLHTLIKLIDQDVFFAYDYGDTPDYPTYNLGTGYVVTDRTENFDVRYQFSESDWGAEGLIPTWPYDSSYLIATPEDEIWRDITWTILGRHQQGEHEYWLYNRKYWEAWAKPGFYDAQGRPMQSGRPDQIRFLNPCEDPTTPGKDIPPKPIPIPIPILIDDKARKQAMKTLRLGLEFKPYEIMCGGQKITCDGQQVTCGDV